ncbi:MAG: serine protease [Polyangiaceae bacterium]
MTSVTDQGEREESGELVSSAQGTLQRHIVNNRWNTLRELALLLKISPAVCRIMASSPTGMTHVGTGFLIDKNHVLTAQHVLAQIRKLRADAKCVFEGEPAIKAEERLSRPPSVADTRPGAPAPVASELDFALLRLASPSSCRPLELGDSPGPAAPVSVLHYPGKLAELAISAGTTSHASTPLRTRYDASTEGGSSGAPVVDGQGRVVAIHHAGSVSHPGLNQGIPIGPIKSLLVAHLDTSSDAAPDVTTQQLQPRAAEPVGTAPRALAAVRQLLAIAQKQAISWGAVAAGFIGLASFVAFPASPACLQREETRRSNAKQAILCVPQRTGERLDDKGDAEGDDRSRLDEIEWKCSDMVPPGQYVVSLTGEVIFCGRTDYRSTERGYRCERGSGDSNSVGATVEVEVLYEYSSVGAVRLPAARNVFLNEEILGDAERHIHFNMSGCGRSERPAAAEAPWSTRPGRCT